MGKSKLIRFNNWVNMWRLGAWDVLELPLLAASSNMETAPMTGKTWQPSHEPHAPTKTGTHHTNKQWKVEGGRKVKKTAKCYTQKAPSSATPINKLCNPTHMEFNAYASTPKPLITSGCSNSLLLHLTISCPSPFFYCLAKLRKEGRF